MAVERRLLYIDGDFVDSQALDDLPVENPSTGELYANAPVASLAQADQAIRAAHRAATEGPWADMQPHERRSVLARFADVLADRTEELVDVVVHEAGAVVREAPSGQVGKPIANMRAIVAATAGAYQSERPTDLSPFEARSTVVHEPIGVCVSIPAFNYPVMITLSHAGNILASGNTVVVKPSPLAPIGVLDVARAAHDAGLPPGVFNVVVGDVDVAEALITHPLTASVAFTGSTAVGRRVMELAAKGLKRVTLELGGKSPSVLLPDGDEALAVRTTLNGVLRAAGQNCVATSRLLVPRDRLSEVAELAASLSRTVCVGPATDPASEIGPLITGQSVDRVERMLVEAQSTGAQVVSGGRRLDLGLGGHYFEPTVVVDEGHKSLASYDEFFAPVLTIAAYDTEDEAVHLANDTEYGLAASVWSADSARAMKVARRIQAGTVWINTWGIVQGRAPFGGFKQSGIGRLFGAEGADNFTEVKHVLEATDTQQIASAYSHTFTGW